MGDTTSPSYYDSKYGSRSNYTGAYVAPPQPMYFNQERLQNERVLQELKESNDLARQQLQLERDRINQERFDRELGSHE